MRGERKGGGKGGGKLHAHVVDNSDPILECSKSHNTIMCRLQLVGIYISSRYQDLIWLQ